MKNGSNGISRYQYEFERLYSELGTLVPGGPDAEQSIQSFAEAAIAYWRRLDPLDRIASVNVTLQGIRQHLDRCYRQAQDLRDPVVQQFSNCLDLLLAAYLRMDNPS